MTTENYLPRDWNSRSIAGLGGQSIYNDIVSIIEITTMMIIIVKSQGWGCHTWNSVFCCRPENEGDFLLISFLFLNFTIPLLCLSQITSFHFHFSFAIWLTFFFPNCSLLFFSAILLTFIFPVSQQLGSIHFPLLHPNCPDRDYFLAFLSPPLHIISSEVDL